MPLVSHNDLPAFERLRREGQIVLSPGRAAHQDIRELHIGLLNMMPDTALAATERQFFRLVGESNPIAQFYMHPFTFEQLPRSDTALGYVNQYYESFELLREQGLDALIITGANVTGSNLSDEPFWAPLREVIEWACQSVTSILCSCLATHAVLEFRYGQTRRRLPDKCWGVFPHRVMESSHPLVHDVNSVFDVPHSRFNDISRTQFEAAGVHVLVESEEAGVHLGTSTDGFRMVYFQGHPEYDTISLLKEYKREVGRFARRERGDYPPLPDNYFGVKEQAILEEYRERLILTLKRGVALPEFPEGLISPAIDNTWHDTAEAIVGNWIGKVYQVTHQDRKRPFMDGVDPENPLGLETIR
ncbi:MAG: homoserine O-succinyltransferase [Gammaproteobacteria bacterium]|nr:homoserine O-succinyltransferase [Gammaproteobacteria bacterium]